MAEEKRTLLELCGSVEHVTYHNDKNQYTVLDLATEAGVVTVVGMFPFVSEGEELRVYGTWQSHPSFGDQFKAETFDRARPATTAAMLKYLSSGAVKGVGPATARRIIDTFGDKALEVMENDPQRLAQIKGITQEKAQEIGEELRRAYGIRELMMFLGTYGVRPEETVLVWKQYGEASVACIQEDPYCLCGEGIDISFDIADAIAESMEKPRDDMGRVQAGILYVLRHNLNNGHTCLPVDKLTRAAAQILSVGPDVVQDGIYTLCEGFHLAAEEIDGQEFLFLQKQHASESYIAARMLAMLSMAPNAIPGAEAKIAAIEREQGIRYAQKQKEAIQHALEQGILILTGGPGTGKTTCLRGVLALFDALGLETALAAPTGRAAKRLGELCGAEGTTIHRLLETQYDPHSGRLVFAHDESDPLKADAVIVDETSMVDITLMHGLLSALRPECRLILVGDPDQLPSVGPGNLFSDLIRSGVIPMVRLTEIFRQAAESAIVRSAHGVNRGELPDLRDNKHDFFFLRRKEPARAAETIVELVKTRLPNNMGIPPEQIQVLSPTRKRTAGTASLNRAIQEAVNPPGPDRPERRFGEYIFRRGDRVMQVRNNYDVVWKDGLTSGMGVFNGDIGQVVEVDNRAELLTVDFDGRRVEYTPDMLGELEPAYAITVHKAQGSEYRAVILAVCEGAPMLLTRGVLYTAITRARELLILVGDEDVVAHMTANDRQQRRYSGLRWRLAQLANG